MPPPPPVTTQTRPDRPSQSDGFCPVMRSLLSGELLPDSLAESAGGPSGIRAHRLPDLSGRSSAPTSLFKQRRHSQTGLRDLAALVTRVLLENPPSEIRGRRKGRVRAAPAVSCANMHERSAHEHTGSAEASGLPCAMVLTVSFVLSSVTGLSCHRHRRDTSRRLDASVGASGPHDFAVRIRAVRQRRIRVHRIPPRVS